METITTLRDHAATLPECGEPLEEWSDGAAKLLLLAAKELELAREGRVTIDSRQDRGLAALDRSRLDTY